MWSDDQRRIERYNRAHPVGTDVLLWLDHTQPEGGIPGVIVGAAYVDSYGTPTVKVKKKKGARNAPTWCLALADVA